MNLGEGPQGDDYMFAALTDVEFGQLEEGFSMSEFFLLRLGPRASFSGRSLWLSELVQCPVQVIVIIFLTNALGENQM